MPYKFDTLYFHFHSVQCIFLIFLKTSSLTHRLFRSMLIRFPVFGEFYVIFMRWISSLFPLCSGNPSQDFNVFNFFLMAQDMVCLRICSIGT